MDLARTRNLLSGLATLSALSDDFRDACATATALLGALLRDKRRGFLIPPSVAQLAPPTGPDEAGTMFVDSVEAWEPLGPSSVDLVTLSDGRVLGINDECVVLYPSREAFENSGHSFDASNCPSINLID